MNNSNRPWSTISYIVVFFLGVILFWSFGKNWLNLESILAFLAGLIGVAIPVLIFGIWNILRNSDHKEN